MPFNPLVIVVVVGVAAAIGVAYMLTVYLLGKRKRYRAVPYVHTGPTDPVTGLCDYEEGFRYEEIKKENR